MKKAYCCLALLLSPAMAADFGPLDVASQSPILSSTLVPKLHEAADAHQGPSRFSARAAIASIWDDAQDGSYFFDYYQNEVALSAATNLAEDWRLHGSAAYHWVGNNHLDSLTKAFHRTLGISQNGRDDVPRHDSHLRIGDREWRGFNGESLDRTLDLYLEHYLWGYERQALSLGGSLFWNDVGGPFSQSRFEQGLQLNYSLTPLAGHRLHLMAGVSHRNDDDYLGIPLRDTNWNAAVGYRYQLAQAHSVLVEYHLSQGLAKDMGQLSDEVHELMLGYRYQWQDSALELTMTENAVSHDNSADIAFTLAYRWQL
ncbi:DUF3187 family protein [Gallaecimonas xiamenensis]|uniref:DUF3187 family protein n=1 Tax=Gallaecimonas xiamenensis 3-C-1 TaxID=745411 RepID=K2JRD1_9GAMM|nr:DUF3187 family protein [Gallaecimonas xiamenensis]EKE77953.1 hypothetical protein B3C1_00795 [Gallaecimonas xiamenensis 3-C-1]